MTAEAGAPVVEFRGCDIGYEGRAVVHGLDLTIPAGEVLAEISGNGQTMGLRLDAAGRGEMPVLPPKKTPEQRAIEVDPEPDWYPDEEWPD